MSKILLNILCLVLSISLFPVYGQQLSTGVVVNESGQPVEGATLRSKLSKKSTVTDAEGRFSINLLLPDTIEINHIGYMPKWVFLVEVKPNIVINLIALNHLIEVVKINTGYQRLESNQINGSVSYVDHKTLQKRNDPNILKRLEGVVNGLTFQIGKDNYNNPQNKTQITIRGYSTIEGPLDPLIVVDDFIYEGDINNINADDVESVTILKDAAATSIYGARGGNGVIVITMRRPAPGEKIKINFGSNLYVTTPDDLRHHSSANSADYIEFERTLFNAGYFNSNLNSLLKIPVTPVVELLDQHKRKEITLEQLESKIEFYKTRDFKKEYSDLFLKNDIMKQFNVSFSGAQDQHAWVVSSHFHNSSDYFDQIRESGSIRLNNFFTLKKWWQLHTTATFSHRSNQSREVPTFETLKAVGTRSFVPYLTFFDETGEQLPFSKSFRTSYTDTVGGGLLQNWDYLPLEDYRHNLYKQISQELMGSIALHFSLMKGLRLSFLYNQQKERSEGTYHYEEDSYYVRNLINQFAQINPNTNIVQHILPKGDILTQNFATTDSYSGRTNLQYDFSNQNIRIGFFGGAEIRESNQKGNSLSYAGYSADPLLYTNIHSNQSYPKRPIGSGGFGLSPVLRPTLITRNVSVFGNGYVQWRNKYSISASLRQDGSNIYGVATNDRWKPLWSLGVGYDLNKESFFKSKVVNSLRLKGSVGYSGNVDQRKSALPIAAYMNNIADVGGLPAANIVTINNPHLRWEQVRQINSGVEFTLFNQSLTGSLDLYWKRGTDLYGPMPYDYTRWGGRNVLQANVSSMKGNGVDFQIDYTYRNARFLYKPRLIYNYSVSLTTKYHSVNNADFYASNLGSTGSMIRPFEGHHFYALTAYLWGGLDDKGNPMGVLNGIPTIDYKALQETTSREGINGGTIRYFGSSIPLHFGALNQDIHYKNFNISVGIAYRLGYFYRNPVVGFGAAVTSGHLDINYSDRWREGNKDTDVPSFVYPIQNALREVLYSASELMVQRADNIRLQYLNFGYRFDLKKTRLKYFDNLQVFVNSSNLGLIWKRTPLNSDPDYHSGPRPNRSFTFGLKLDL